MVRGPQTNKAKLWKQRLQRFQEQALSVPLFCKNEGISTSSFYRWRRLFRNQQKATTHEHGDGKQKTFKQTPFKTVQLISDQKTPREEAPLRIQLPGGIQIQVHDNQAVIQTVFRELTDKPGEQRC